MAHHGKNDVYVNVAERFKRGDRSMLVVPFDYMLLESLPAYGSNVGGMYQLGTSVHDIQKNVFKGLSSDEIASRLRTLLNIGLVHMVRMVGDKGKKNWQRTELGDKELASWSQPTA